MAVYKSWITLGYDLEFFFSHGAIHTELFSKSNKHTSVPPGLDIHFIHVKPPQLPAGRTPKPLLMVHGWPGSFFEFYNIIPFLTDPKNHGLSDEHIFEVICPSIPGYGYSEASSKKGMGASGGRVTAPASPDGSHVFPPGSPSGRVRQGVTWDNFLQNLRMLGKGPEAGRKKSKRGGHFYYAKGP